MTVRSFGGVRDELKKLLKVVLIGFKVYMRGVENEKRRFIVMCKKVIVTLRELFKVFSFHCVLIGSPTFLKPLNKGFWVSMKINHEVWL